MTEKRQFCPKGHDTFEVGRDSSYRCLACKAESSRAARDARRAEQEAVRWARQLEQNEALGRQVRERQRQLERLSQINSRKNG
jgi:hypothetical protein